MGRREWEFPDAIHGESATFSIPQLAQWRALVGGRRLALDRTHSAYSPGGVGDGSFASKREETYDFCSTGEYGYEMRSESYLSVEGVGGMSSTESDGHQGGWRLIGDIIGGLYLVLESTNGQVLYLTVEETEGSILLDGNPYSYQHSPTCR